MRNSWIANTTYEVQMPQAHRVVPTTINMGNHSWKAIEIIYETSYIIM